MVTCLGRPRPRSSVASCRSHSSATLPPRLCPMTTSGAAPPHSCAARQAAQGHEPRAENKRCNAISLMWCLRHVRGSAWAQDVSRGTAHTELHTERTTA